MSRKKRPDLKDYLRTGVIRVFDPAEEEREPGPEETVERKGTGEATQPSAPAQTMQSSVAPAEDIAPREEVAGPKPEVPRGVTPEEVLALLSERDRPMWETMLQAASEIARRPLDAEAARADFAEADPSRFTYYLLPSEGAALSPVRSAGQLTADAKAILKWDENGAAILWLRA